MRFSCKKIVHEIEILAGTIMKILTHMPYAVQFYNHNNFHSRGKITHKNPFSIWFRFWFVSSSRLSNASNCSSIKTAFLRNGVCRWVNAPDSLLFMFSVLCIFIHLDYFYFLNIFFLFLALFRFIFVHRNLFLVSWRSLDFRRKYAYAVI